MYTVRTQFRVPTSTRISLDEFVASAGNLSWTLKSNEPYHVLTVRGFSSEEEATTFLGRLPAAMAHLLLERGIAAEVSFQPKTVIYFPDPVAAAEGFSRAFGMNFEEPIDGVINGPGTAVFPTAKNLRVATGGFASVYSTLPAEHAMQILLAGANLAGARHLVADHKLATALNLYAAYFNEQSAAARFLTLIMALEALAVSAPKSPLALELLGRWSNEVQDIRESIRGNDADEASLEALERQLHFLRHEDSIRGQIRKLVANELRDEQDATEQARHAVRLYDLRSTLVHTGFLDPTTLDTATSRAKILVHSVISSRFKRVTANA